MRNNNRIKLSLILKILVLVNLLFLCLYEFSFKEYILNTIRNNPDYFDRVYYENIFNYLEYPLITVTLILIVLLRYKNYFKLKLLSFSNERLLLIFVFSSVLIIQLGLILFVKNIPFSDSAFYIKLADRLFATGSYTSDYGFKTAFWPVGLPAFLAFLHLITNHYILGAKLINIILFLSLIFVTYKLFLTHLSPAGKIIFLLSFSFFPNNLFSSNVILTDYPFTLLIWIILYLVLKFPLKKSVLVGILLAVAAYLRPIGLLIPLIIILYYTKFYGFKKSLSYFSGILIVFFISLAPWTIRNYQVFGEFVPVSTNGGYNFLIGNNCNATGKYEQNIKYNFRNPNEVAESKNAYNIGFQNISKNLSSSLVLIPKKILFSYYRDDSSITWSLKETKNNVNPIFQSYSFLITNYWFYVIFLVSIISLIKNNWFNIKPSLRFIILLTFGYIMGFIIIFFGSERFIIPILPIHFFLASKFIGNSINS